MYIYIYKCVYIYICKEVNPQHPVRSVCFHKKKMTSYVYDQLQLLQIPSCTRFYSLKNQC